MWYPSFLNKVDNMVNLKVMFLMCQSRDTLSKKILQCAPESYKKKLLKKNNWKDLMIFFYIELD